MSIPISNAFVERVFTLSEGQCTDERNRLSVETVASILQVLVNFDSMKCRDMYTLLSGNPSLLNKIASSKKYNV
jgi:hypothetical protein